MTEETKCYNQLSEENHELTAIKKYFEECLKCTTMLDYIKAANNSIAQVINNIATSLFVKNGENEYTNLFVCGLEQVRFIDLGIDQKQNYIGFNAIRDMEVKTIDINYHSDAHAQKVLTELGVKTLTSFPIINNGEAFAALTVATDRTCPFSESELAFCQTLCGYLSYQLKEGTRERLELNEKRNSEFFASLSHELKTPINIILSSVQLIRLQDQANNIVSNKDKFNSYIEQNAYRLLRLVTNLIDATKIDNSFLQIGLSKADIIDALYTITKSCDSYAMAKKISISFDTDIDELNIYFDHSMLDRIMLNLLSNAIKHTPIGGEIDVKVSDESEYIRVSMSDNGCGIPADAIPVIFDKFKLVNANLTRSCEGSGLGLSIVKALVKMHNGSVHARSYLGEGSCFEFTIAKNLLSKFANNCKENITPFNYDEDVRQTRISIEMSNNI